MKKFPERRHGENVTHFLAQLLLVIARESSREFELTECANLDDPFHVLLSDVEKLIEIWLGIPLEDRNPSGRDSFTGPDDYCSDWFWNELHDMGEIKDPAQRLRAARALVLNCRPASRYRTEEEESYFRAHLKGDR